MIYNIIYNKPIKQHGNIHVGWNFLCWISNHIVQLQEEKIKYQPIHCTTVKWR